MCHIGLDVSSKRNLLQLTTNVSFVVCRCPEALHSLHWALKEDTDVAFHDPTLLVLQTDQLLNAFEKGHSSNLQKH